MLTAIRQMANQIRQDIIEMLVPAKSGHPGGSLSAADILAVLYFSVLKIDPQNPQWRSDSTVLFVGYQAEGTLGRRLIDGAKEVTIHGERISVNADIINLPGFSSHADQNELLRWINTSCSNLRGIFLVHGEEMAMNVFSDVLQKEKGITPIIPELGEVVEFVNNQIIRNIPEKPWLKLVEEKLSASISKEEDVLRNLIAKNLSRTKGITLSEVNYAYDKLKKDLREFINVTKKERDYNYLYSVIDSVAQILEEAKKR